MELKSDTELEKMSKDELVEYVRVLERLADDNFNRSEMRKLFNNSLYGTISNVYSRFYNINLATSVTMTGQMIEKFQAWKANEIIKEKAKNRNG